MLLDACLLALVAASAVLGALAGLLRPLFLFAGTVAGWFAARHLAVPAARLAPASVPPWAARSLAAVLTFLVVAGLVAWAGRLLARNRQGDGRPTDRAAGALLGGMTAVAVAWVGLSVAEAAAPALPDGVQAALASSDLASLVRENDMLGEWRRRADGALRALLGTAGRPGGASRLAADPELRSLMEDPRVRALVDEAREVGNEGVARSPDAIRLLSDPAFRARLEAAQERLNSSR